MAVEFVDFFDVLQELVLHALAAQGCRSIVFCLYLAAFNLHQALLFLKELLGGDPSLFAQLKFFPVHACDQVSATGQLSLFGVDARELVVVDVGAGDHVLIGLSTA